MKLFDANSNLLLVCHFHIKKRQCFLLQTDVFHQTVPTSARALQPGFSQMPLKAQW